MEQSQRTLASADVGFTNDAAATVRSQNDGSGFAGGHSSLPSTISLLTPTQAPKLNVSDGPTPLPSIGISSETIDSLTATQRSTRPAQVKSQPSSAASFDLPNEMAQRAPASKSAITLTPPSTSSRQSIGFNAAQLRKFMNQQSLNPMASGHVLADKEAKWDVLQTDGASGHSTSRPTTSIGTVVNAEQDQVSAMAIQSGDSGEAQRSNNPFRMASSSRDVTNEEFQPVPESSQINDAANSGATYADVASQQPFPATGDEQPSDASEPTASPKPDNDDSMLNRLKGLYDPSEDGVARRIWGRQMPKLPNPWSVFREREQPSSPAVEPPAVSAAVNPEDIFTSDSGEQASISSASLLSQLVREYEARLTQWPKTPAERPENPAQYQKLQQELRLLYLMQDRPEDAMSAVELLSPAEQQFWQSMMLSLAEYRKAKASDAPSGHFTGSVHQLRSAIQALSPLADLRIRRLEICERIHSYGRIETFPSNDFDPGQPLLLYVELENFGSQMTPSGRYLASFDATLQIFEKDKDSPKETIRLTDITDEATSARTDYFQSYDLTLPSHLMTGEYEIRLKIRDKLTGKASQSVVSFQVR